MAATRETRLAALSQHFDLLVVGGGITGAGIALEGARRGLKVLLVEQKDFAWGSSSRSSKLVHGGLRYIKEGQLHLTLESVRERQQLLKDAPGLVAPQRFVLGDYDDSKPGRRLLSIGLTLYDMMAGERTRRYWPATDFMLYAPHIRRAGLRGGSGYLDAKTDDARLVLRVLAEAERHGAVCLNYIAAAELIQGQGRVTGAVLADATTGTQHRVSAKVVINATGAWADGLRGNLGAAPKLRPLRGSHLIFPLWRVPVGQAVSFMHPWDGRPVFVYPWEGVALLGTTDLDHADVNREAAITPEEVAYLMAGICWQFPNLNLTLDDVLSTYAGVRPVLSTGAADPSKEARDHIVLQESGLVTVTGGKLTTFRRIALDTLKRIRHQLPHWRTSLTDEPIFAATTMPMTTNPALKRLHARYGEAADHIVGMAQEGELAPIGTTDILWAELRWAARCEQVVHLEDLLLRRTRLGILCKRGGAEHLPAIRSIAMAELGWDADRWQTEVTGYLSLIANHYSLPNRETIPGWDKKPAHG